LYALVGQIKDLTHGGGFSIGGGGAQRSREGKLYVNGTPFLVGGRPDSVQDSRAHTDEKKKLLHKNNESNTYHVLSSVDIRPFEVQVYSLHHTNLQWQRKALSNAKDISWQQIIEQY